MEIDGKRVIQELEAEIKPLFERTYNIVLDLIDKAEEKKLDRPAKVGDCYAKITRLGTEEAIVIIGLCVKVDHNHHNPLAVYYNQPSTSTLYLFKELEIKSSGYSYETVKKYWVSDLWFVDSQQWYRTEKMIQIVKSTYDAIVERSMDNDNR